MCSWYPAGPVQDNGPVPTETVRRSPGDAAGPELHQPGVGPCVVCQPGIMQHQGMTIRTARGR